ncbi:hypothetical protein E4U58_005276 [Claviceps cyperi]|nr:hypothetical protein E4U58_005276 [Claviceps cyperi]
MSSTRAVEMEPTMSDMIDSGRYAYAAKKYKRALVLFRSAMMRCPCARGVKRDRCNCKNYEQVAAHGGSIFREAMYTCHCDVGRTFSKCDNARHIQALDFRAATFEAMDKLDHAMKDAEWILELAPRLPDGYLRLGKIARLQKKNEYAWKMYTAGIEANKETAVGSSPKLQQLHSARKPLHRHFSRQDPLCLPAELVAHIFSYLDFVEIPVCLRVCKQWKRTLTSPLHCRLWRNIIFPEQRMDLPGVGVLKKMLSWAGQGGARKIVIPKVRGLTSSKLMLLLHASPSLEHLDLGDLPPDMSFPLEEKLFYRLKHVSFRSVGYSDRTSIDFPGGFSQIFLQNAASSLEHLTIAGEIPQPWYGGLPSVPLLPKLKTLRMAVTVASPLSFSIFYLSVAFPRLEQLCIDCNIPNLDPEPVAIWRGKWEDVWPHLKVLILSTRSWRIRPYLHTERLRSTIRYLTCLNRGNSLRHIRFDFPRDDWSDIVTGSHNLFHDFDVAQCSEYQNLHSFRSTLCCITGDEARTLLSNAIKTKQLTAFDIVFPEESLTDRVGDASIRHLKTYEWSCGAPTVQMLGCHGFRFRQYPENDEDLPLPRFLASFPNLRTLSISSNHYASAEFATVVVAIMRLTHLETIYTRSVEGVALDQLRQVAQDLGVRLVHGSLPGPWPVPLGT